MRYYAHVFKKGCLALDWYPARAHAKGGREGSDWQRIWKTSSWCLKLSPSGVKLEDQARFNSKPASAAANDWVMQFAFSCVALFNTDLSSPWHSPVEDAFQEKKRTVKNPGTTHTGHSLYK